MSERSLFFAKLQQLKAELGMPAQLSAAAAIAQAQQDTGVHAEGALGEQIDALLQAIGLSVASSPVAPVSASSAAQKAMQRTQSKELEETRAELRTALAEREAAISQAAAGARARSAAAAANRPCAWMSRV